MPKLYYDDLSGGLVEDFPPHLLQFNQLSKAEEVVFRKGIWEKRPGYTQPFTATGDANTIIEISDHVRSDGSNILVLGTTDRLYRLNGTSWEERHNLSTTRTLADKWRFTEIAGSLYATNGVDHPLQTTNVTTTNFTNISWDTSTIGSATGESITTAKDMLAFNNRLLFFNITTTSDGLVTNRIGWTNPFDYDRFVPDNTNDLNYSDAPLIRAKKLRNGFIAAYKTDSVATVQDRGDPLFFVPVFSKLVGLFAPNCVADLPEGHLLLSNAGFHIFTGGQLSDVGNDEIVGSFFSDLDTTKKDSIYMFTDWFNREVHIMYPSNAASTSEPDKTLIFNWQYGLWYRWNRGEFCGFQRYRNINTPVNYYGTTSGNVRQEGGSTDNGAAITSKIRLRPFSSRPQPSDPNPQTISVISKISTDARPNTTTVKLGRSDYSREEPTFSSTGTIDDRDGYVPSGNVAPVSGKYVTPEFENFDSISEVSIVYEGSGDE